MRFFLKACQPKPMQSYFRSAGRMMDYSQFTLEPIKIAEGTDKFPLIPEGSKLLCIRDALGGKGFEAVYICETTFEIALMMSFGCKELIRFAIAPKECFLQEKIMSREEIKALMSNSKSEKEWDDNCLKVKTLFGGEYPGFWFSTISLIESSFLKNLQEKSTHDTSNETNEDCKRKGM